MGHSSGALSEVNLPELLDRVGGDSDLLREITTIFLEEYPQLLEDIRSAVARCDDHLLERSAHSLKGSVSNFGAESATAAAYSLEQLGQQRRRQVLPDSFRNSRRSCQHSCRHSRQS